MKQEDKEWWDYHGYLLCLHKHQFPKIKWEEPTKVKLMIK